MVKVEQMPEISRFYGITIYIFQKDHNPPHIHVEHQGFKLNLKLKKAK